MKYEKPELKLVGEAEDVVLGVDFAGGDLIGQSDYYAQEFEQD